MTRPADGSDDGFDLLGFDRAIDSADPDLQPSRAQFDRAAQIGRRRRSKKLMSIAAGTAVAAVATVSVGSVSLLRGTEPDQVVFTDRDTTIPTETMPTETKPTETSVPEPSTTLAAVEPPNISFPTTDSVSDLFVTVSGDREAVIDVRNSVDVVASFDMTCPSDRSCHVQSARIMGDAIWVAISEYDLIDVWRSSAVRSRVLSASMSSGEIVEHLELPGPEEVSSAGLGADGTLYGRLSREKTLITIEDGQATVVESSVSGFRLSDDGRFLAVSFSNPPRGEMARFEVTDLFNDFTVGFDTNDVNAGPAAWSPDGRFLIIDEQWEDGRAWVVDPWSGSGARIAGTDAMLDGACFISSRIVAHRTWSVGYGQGDAQLGAVQLVSLSDGSLVTGSADGDLGSNLFGDAIRCHADGSVSYLRRPVHDVEPSPGFVQLEPDDEAPVELIHIATDGTVSTRASGDLRMV
jgi:hypothetical protein